jgi:hypothetical protein
MKFMICKPKEKDFYNDKREYADCCNYPCYRKYSTDDEYTEYMATDDDEYIPDKSPCCTSNFIDISEDDIMVHLL